MLRDDDIMTIERERPDDHQISGVVEMPDPAQNAIVDVVSMKALVRAVANLRRPNTSARNNGEFERALVKIINLNGALARSILSGERR